HWSAKPATWRLAGSNPADRSSQHSGGIWRVQMAQRRVKTDHAGCLVLGLDLGPSSAAWALVKTEAESKARLIGMGVRYFPEGVDNFDTSKEVSRNEARRIAR